MKKTFKKILATILALVTVLSVAATMVSCDILDGITGGKKEKDYSELKNTVVYKTENFEIDGAMLRYIFCDKYQKLTVYSRYISLDPSKPIENQAVGSSEAVIKLIGQIFGDDVYTGGTYFDLLWDVTEKEAKQLLAFCEAAKSDGVELSGDEIAKIDSNIQTVAQRDERYFESAFGKGINEDDVRRAMLLISLRDKYVAEQTDRISDGITDEEVETYFKNNEEKYTTKDMYVKVKKFAHIIVSEYADDESHPAKAEAERILAEFLSGEMTRERFDKLSKDKKTFANKIIGNVYSFTDGVSGDYIFSDFFVTGGSFGSSGSVSFETSSGTIVSGTGSTGGLVITVGGMNAGSEVINISDEDGFYDDVRPGKTSEKLNEWLFAENRAENDTEIIVVESNLISKDGSDTFKTAPGYDYHVMWYLGEGEEIWFLDSKNDYCDELVSEWKDQTETSVSVTDVGSGDVKDKISD